MILTLSSKQFVFDRAKALFLRKDQPDENVEGLCVENVISNLDIASPGIYNLWLSDMEVLETSVGRKVRLDGTLFPWTVELRKDDLDRAAKTVDAPPGGVFRISVLDSRRAPVPHHKLLAWADETTVELQMDAMGSKVTYDNPTQCFIAIDPGFAIVIERLDAAAEK